MIGPDNMTIMAGPCAVEGKEQLLSIAHAVSKAGATFLRGGAYKPRTSPYSFQGLEAEGLIYMQEAAKETGLSTICEVVSLDAIEAAVKYVDMIQIGTRNMQNFMLLKEAGRSGMPVLLKRGLCATVEEWLNAAEYIIAEGNPKVVLCERGIRTFETATRNTLDLSVVPVLKTRTHLPVIIDPSHATGSYKYVPSMAKAAVEGGDHKRVPNNCAENPTIVGHEFCGDIVEVGENWKHKYNVGDKFVIQPAHYPNGSQ